MDRGLGLVYHRTFSLILSTIAGDKHKTFFADHSEIRTGAAAVPEPSSSFVLAIMLGLLCRRKKL